MPHCMRDARAPHVRCICTQAQQHLGRVERVNEQLKELYGPLLACVTASKSAYDAMVQQVGGAATDGPSFRAAVRAAKGMPVVNGEAMLPTRASCDR